MLYGPHRNTRCTYCNVRVSGLCYVRPMRTPSRYFWREQRRKCVHGDSEFARWKLDDRPHRDEGETVCG